MAKQVRAGVNGSRGCGGGWFHEWTIDGGEQGYYERAREENSVLGPEGCCFPGNCCMPGPHYESECHTPEMLMAQEGEPQNVRVSDQARKPESQI
jgi:hypothetical protein